MKYITLSVLSLQAGAVLGLTAAQAALRQHVLTPAPGRIGWYTTTGPVQFKRGEAVLFEGDLPKHLAEAVDSPETRQTKAKAKAKAQQVANAEAEAAETAASALALDAALSQADAQD